MLDWTHDRLLNEFITGYIDAMLWSTLDDTTAAEKFLDEDFTADDLTPDAKAAVIKDCTQFYVANLAYLEAGPTEDLLQRLEQSTPMEYAGHDFWLTREGHGCGYWDGDWPEPAATVLTSAAEKFGEVYPYVISGQIDF